MRTVAICAVGIILMAFAVRQNDTGADDFRQFYRAATLVRGHESVYSHPSFSPVTNRDEDFLPYNRIPSYALALSPLASLPYSVARRVWIAFIVLVFAGCVGLVPSKRDRLAIALAFSVPVAFTIALGQDIGLVLLIALASARMCSRKHEFSGGVVASLVAIKLTYLPAIGLVFLAKSRRGSLGLALGGTIQLAVSFAVGGLDWPARYLAQMRNSFSTFEVRRMPDIRGALSFFALPDAAWLIGAAILSVGLFLAARRLRMSQAIMLALPLGLIAAPYGFVYDAVVMIPLLVSVANLHTRAGLVAAVALAPFPYLLMMAGNPVLVFAGSASVVIGALVAAASFHGARDESSDNDVSVLAQQSMIGAHAAEDAAS